MYTIWNVTFHVKHDSRGPCDPVYQMEPLTRGSVGDADPFSDAFGQALRHAEDRLPFRYEQASSVASDTSDLFSLHSSVQASPFTPNTTHSTFSQSDGRGSMGRQLPYLPIPPNLDYYAGNTDSATLPPPSAEGLKSLQSTLSKLSAKLENEDENNPFLQAATPGLITLSEFRSQTKPASDTKRKTKPCVKQKRKRKTPFLTTRRPPVKSREQHLSDNKAAAARCRQQRRAWESHLQDVSVMLKASIDVSKSEINELVSELAALKRQLWACSDCTDQYMYSCGLKPSGIPLDRDGSDTACERSDKPSTGGGPLVGHGLPPVSLRDRE